MQDLTKDNTFLYELMLNPPFYNFIQAFKPTEGMAYSPMIQHKKFAYACLNMIGQLRFNICGLPSSFIPDREVLEFERRVKENIGETLQYCYQFWSHHFIQSEF